MVQIERGGGMNKYQEALEYLTEEAHSNYFRKYVQTSKEKALQELVNKAIPKKPKEILEEAYCGEIPSEKEIFYLCPVCNEFVGDEYDNNNYYCPNCGQAINWSVEDDKKLKRMIGVSNID